MSRNRNVQGASLRPRARQQPGKLRPSNRFSAEMPPAPISAPSAGKDPWEISRPHMTLNSEGKAGFGATLRRAISLLRHAISYFFYGRFLPLTERNPRRRQELKAQRLRKSMQSL